MKALPKPKLAILVMLGTLACKSNPGYEAKAPAAIHYDTITFGSKILETRNKAALALPVAIYRNEAMLLPTSGPGKGVWPDSILYLRKGPTWENPTWFAAVATTVVGPPMFFHYDGNRLYVRSVARSFPTVNVFRPRRLEVVEIMDTLYNGGNIIRTHLFYTTDSAGHMDGPTQYYPTRFPDGKGGHLPYEFTITTRANADSVVVLSDGKVEQVFK